MIRILLVDDQRIIREGLRSLLEARPDLTVVAEADNGLEALEMAERHRPDIVLMDVRMPVMDGVEATKRIKAARPETAIIVLTTFDDDEYILQALAYGAAGYLLKDIGGDRLVEAIRDGRQGNIILPGRVAAKVARRLSPPPPAAADFTEREREVIALLVAGKNNKEIAAALYLSVGTVKNYTSQIYLKLGVNDRAKALVSLKEWGF